MDDMRTLAFPQALGTGIVIQTQLHVSDSTETDNQATNPISQMTDSAETDNHGTRQQTRLSNSPKTDDQHANPAPRMADSAESDIREMVTAFLRTYEQTLSRFREESLVSAMRRATHGGSFDFPDWAGPLFDLYDALHKASDGAIDPCVGEDLIRLGYGPAYTFTVQPDARERAGAVHGRATWHDSVERHGCTLVTRGPVSLDFGACGKGYAADLIAALLRGSKRTGGSDSWRNGEHGSGCNGGHGNTRSNERGSRHDDGRGSAHDSGHDVIDRVAGDPRAFRINGSPRTNGSPCADKSTHANESAHICTTNSSAASHVPGRAFVIDAGGDLLVHLNTPPTQPRHATTPLHAATPLRIALEHPADPTQAVGIAELTSGALCASAPSRRHWGEAAGIRLHHMLNAIDGLPADDIAATWAYVPEQTAPFPCALADGLATALFVTDPDRLRARFRFACAFIDANGMMHASQDFPATLFIA